MSQKPKRKNKPGAGRPDEGRERLTIHVLPNTAKAIRSGMTEERNTLGKVIDSKFGN